MVYHHNCYKGAIFRGYSAQSAEYDRSVLTSETEFDIQGAMIAMRIDMKLRREMKEIISYVNEIVLDIFIFANFKS